MHSTSQSAALPKTGRRAWLAGGLLPAALVLAVALAVLLVRPPLPIDETRYVEVFRESLKGSPLLLRLLGEPYAEKTPLLFWIARALTWLALPPEVALRLVSALVSSLVVLVVARLGAGAGLALSGWVQAALWIPLLAAQFLHFDPLLSLAVWCTVDAWVRRRELAFALWSAVALLAKGPVGLLFVIPFLWATQPLRGARQGDARRAALVLVLALVPLATWALAAAARGGPEFANALLWERWAGRIGQGASHSRSYFFYLPVVLVGALPGTLLLFRRAEERAPAWIRRLGWALGFVLLAFSLIRGKQAHYLEPAVPGLALWLAWRIEREPRALPLLRAGVRVQLALLLAVAVACVFVIPRHLTSIGERGRELVANGGTWFPLALAGAAALAGVLVTLRAQLTARSLLVVALASTSVSVLPIQRLAGELLYPHVLARALAVDPATPIAYVGGSHHGIYALLSARDDLEKLGDAAELEAYCNRAPHGLLLVDWHARPDPMPARLTCIARDVVHRSEIEVWRVEERGTVASGFP